MKLDPTTSNKITSAAAGGSAYDRLKVSPVVNACGIYTDLGGSILSDTTWQALTELNRSFVDMLALLDRTGARIAELVGAQAARVTPGASSAIALSVAACLVSCRGSLGERLPNLEGLKGEVIFQHLQHEAYKYLGPVRLTGATVVLAGNEGGASIEHIERSIGPKTAAVFIPAHLDDLPGCVPLTNIIPLAHDRGVPVVVDAAYMSYPPAHMRRYAALGADLTCFSAKYYGGPNAGGFVSGSEKYVQGVRDLEFTRHESGSYRRFGRAFKMGRYDVAAVQLALEEWFDMDHARRLESHALRAERIADRLRSSPDLQVELGHLGLHGRLAEGPVNAVLVKLTGGIAKNASEVLRELAAGTPSVLAMEIDGRIILVTETLRDEEVEVVAGRILHAVG